VRAPGHLPLYWNVCLINGAVFLVGTLVLVLSPLSVSSRVLVSEAVVVSVGLVIMLLTNALLIRRSLAPLDRVIRTLEGIDQLRPGDLPEEGAGPVRGIARSVNRLLDRLETAQRAGKAQALAAQEAERHRIAQELHDEVGQSLTVVLLGLKRVESRAPSELVEELALVRESARAGLDDVRRVARRLRPGVLEDLGLTWPGTPTRAAWSCRWGGRARQWCWRSATTAAVSVARWRAPGCWACASERPWWTPS